MQRAFLPNLAFILIINLIIKPLYIFGVEVGVQNELGAEEYGLFFALLNSAYLLQIINDFGLQILNNREVALKRDQTPGLIPGLTSVKLLFSLIYLGLLSILGYVLGYQDFMGLFMLVGLNLIFASFILFLRSGVSGLGFYRLDSVLSVTDKVLMILMIGGMLVFLPAGEFTLYHFVLGQTGALLLTMVLAGITLAVYGGLRVSGFHWGTLRKLVVKALPYALAVFFMTLYTRSDGVMIKGLLLDGDLEAGVYAGGYRILDAFNMVAFLFAAMLLPMFSRALDEKSEVNGLADEGVRYMTLLVVPVVCFGVLYAQQIMKFLYVEADLYWGQVFVFLIISFIATGVMYVFGTLLTAAGRLRQMNMIYGATVLLNVILNFILIPIYKAQGAAIATAATQLFAAFSITFLCFRQLGLVLPGSRPVAIVVFGAGCFVSYWFLGMVALPGHWYLTLPVMLVITFVLSWALGILRLNELRTILGAPREV